jgi:hypothetical protein
MNLLFEPPDPLRMASLPVDWMAATMADGAAMIARQGLVNAKRVTFVGRMGNYGTNRFLRWSPVDL